MISKLDRIFRFTTNMNSQNIQLPYTYAATLQLDIMGLKSSSLARETTQDNKHFIIQGAKTIRIHFNRWFEVVKVHNHAILDTTIFTQQGALS